MKTYTSLHKNASGVARISGGGGGGNGAPEGVSFVPFSIWFILSKIFFFVGEGTLGTPGICEGACPPPPSPHSYDPDRSRNADYAQTKA